MKTDELANWKTQLDSEAEQLRAKMAPLVERLRVVMEQQELVTKLLRLEGPASTASKPLNIPLNAEVNEIVQAILVEAGAPMHISAIRTRYLEAGFTIPGAGSESNLISYMTRSNTFRRVSKGTYELATPPQGAKHG